MVSSCKYRRCNTTALIKNISESIKGIGLSCQLYLPPQKNAMFARILHYIEYRP